MKSEIRISKSETNSKQETRMLKTFLVIPISHFEFVSDFDIRASDFSPFGLS